MLFSPQNRLAFCQKHFTQKNSDPQGYAAPTRGHFAGELQEAFTVTFQIFPDFSVASRLAPVSSRFSPKDHHSTEAHQPAVSADKLFLTGGISATAIPKTSVSHGSHPKNTSASFSESSPTQTFAVTLLESNPLLLGRISDHVTANNPGHQHAKCREEFVQKQEHQNRFQPQSWDHTVMMSGLS
ncbi:hypothetical protein Anapl_00706 [Anas platyrhynchos]|uniref:Uncharacterized protein n=1 Tax=Anas platyrhynchos TaxID=8839 RepID=R0LSH7_ANAPL|nr:hypothetical protein Anapl_00706 [Anas platyrhynchos]